jgi:hypothetical protein
MSKMFFVVFLKKTTKLFLTLKASYVGLTYPNLTKPYWDVLTSLNTSEVDLKFTLEGMLFEGTVKGGI